MALNGATGQRKVNINSKAMLRYDEINWDELGVGYGNYNPTSALKKLESAKNHKEAWGELWEELHHQGDVNLVSYAVVPYLVQIHKEMKNLDWNLYALVSVIEIERHRKTNPLLPEWLEQSYKDAWTTLFHLALNDLLYATDETSIRAMLSVIALAKGLFKDGSLIINLDESAISEYFDEYMS